MTTPDDHDPSPILALARELHGLLEATCTGHRPRREDLNRSVFRARQLAEELCDAIEEDEFWRRIPHTSARGSWPDCEAWLRKNPAALQMVQEGIRQAAAGELVPCPDLDADQPVLEVVVSNILDSADRAYDFGELERKVQDQYGIPLPPLAVRTATWNLIEQDRAALAPGFRVIARTPRIPNALTRKTLADADAGRGVVRYADTDAMFADMDPSEGLKQYSDHLRTLADIAMDLIELDDNMEPEGRS